jgi:hypothetical protein
LDESDFVAEGSHNPTSPLDYGIPVSPAASAQAAEEEVSIPSSAPASSTTTPGQTEEDEAQMLEYVNRVRMQDHWRSGQVLWIRTHQHAGYVFNYGFDPTRVSEWIGHGDHLNVTPLPANMRVLYRHVPTDEDAEYFKAFTVEQVNGMDMEALGIYFAADWFGDILENIAGDTPDHRYQSNRRRRRRRSVPRQIHGNVAKQKQQILLLLHLTNMATCCHMPTRDETGRSDVGIVGMWIRRLYPSLRSDALVIFAPTAKQNSRGGK